MFKTGRLKSPRLGRPPGGAYTVHMLIYRVLADIILVIHFAIVLFVIFGLLLTLIGLTMRWVWVRNF